MMTSHILPCPLTPDNLPVVIGAVVGSVLGALLLIAIIIIVVSHMTVT